METDYRDMTPPEGEITPAQCEWPTEPLDACHPDMPQTALMLAPAVAKLTQVRRALTKAPLLLPATTVLVRRAEWGARAPKGRYERLVGSPITTFHWEGPTMGAFGHDKCDGKVRTIQAYHMDHQKWLDIAYTMLVCPHGWLYEGRGYWNRTAANGTNPGNAGSYAVCFIGGIGDPFTNEAKRAFLDAILYLRKYGGAGAETKVHGDWFQTQCPGSEITAWERANCPPPPGYNAMPDPTAPVPPPNGGGVLTTRVADTIGFIDHPSNDGGWLVTKAGAIYTKAPAEFYGSLGAIKLNAPIAAFLPTPSGKGYWLFGEDGGVFSFGDAPFTGAYAAFGDEYRQGIHKVAGAYFRGDPNNRDTWRYSYVSDKLESYDI